MKRHAEARADLRAYLQARPQNTFDADTHLQTVLRHHLGAETFDAEQAGWQTFGAECATVIDDWVRETNRDEHLPRLRRYDGLGHRIEEVCFHPQYFDIGERVYRTGVMSRYAQAGNEMVQLVYAYLFGTNGEGGHLCPLACTAGLIKILQQVAPPAVAERFLPGLLRTDRNHPAHFHGAQFLTEIQGGSDVGANACVASPGDDGIWPGTWRINGEKWFCSVIDADLYLMSARPENAPSGTRGLSAFVVPRLLPDGRTNGVHIRRLKYKLGTRSMASGEADFVDAVAWPVAVEGGFKPLVEIVLNTSRLYNAIGSCASMRRVLTEAEAYAAHRNAFGQPIERFPLIQRTLAGIRRTCEASVAGTFALAALSDQLVTGAAPEYGADLYRLVVNMNKYRTSLDSTRMVLEGIEVFGGNGAIEEFSVLPRLLRDAIVCEQWEGTHNVLCAQVLRDLHKYRLHTAFFKHADRVKRPAALRARIDADRVRVDALLAAPPEEAAWQVRDVVDALSRTWQQLCLADLAA